MRSPRWSWPRQRARLCCSAATSCTQVPKECNPRPMPRPFACSSGRLHPGLHATCMPALLFESCCTLAAHNLLRVVRDRVSDRLACPCRLARERCSWPALTGGRSVQRANSMLSLDQCGVPLACIRWWAAACVLVANEGVRCLFTQSTCLGFRHVIAPRGPRSSPSPKVRLNMLDQPAHYSSPPSCAVHKDSNIPSAD